MYIFGPHIYHISRGEKLSFFPSLLSAILPLPHCMNVATAIPSPKAAMSSHSLDLSHFPPTFLLPTRLAQSQVNDLTGQLLACKCPLASAPAAATIFLGDINTTKRCEFELRGRRLKLTPTATPETREVRVVKLKWFTESQARSAALPIEDYVVYSGYLEPPNEAEAEGAGKSRSEKLAADQRRREGILERARRDRMRISVEREIEARDDLSQKSELSATSDRQRRGIGELMAISKPKDKKTTRPGTPEYEEQERIVSRGRPRTIRDMPDWVQQSVRTSFWHNFVIIYSQAFYA